MAIDLGQGYVTILPSTAGFATALGAQTAGAGTAAGATAAKGVGGSLVAGLARFAGPVALALGAAAVGKFVFDSTKEFIGFEQKMREVYTLLPGISKDAMGEMQEDVKTLARDMGVLPNDAVPALYQAISAGVPKENVFDFLETAQRAAVGGVTDLETAVDGISSVVNAYGEDVIDATSVSDLMFQAVKGGKTTIDEMSASLFQVIPTAASLGVEFGDVTAGLATMTAAGTPTRVATTQMRQALIELSKGGTVASDTFKELSGQTFKDFIASGGNTQEALQLLEEHAKGSGVGINELFGSVEAGQAALALTGAGTEKYTQELLAAADAAGATDEAYKTMNDGTGRAIDSLKASWATVKLDVGEVFKPIGDAAVGVFADFVKGISVGIPIAIGFVKDFVSSAKEVAAFFTDGFTGGGDPEALVGPMRLIYDAGAKVSEIFETVSDFSKRLWENLAPLRETFAATAAILAESFNPIMEKLKQLWVDLQPTLSAVAGSFKNMAIVLGGVLAVAVGIAVGLINGVVLAIGPLVEAALGLVKTVVSVVNLIIGVFTGDGEMIKEAVAGIGEGIVAVFGGLWGAIKGFLSGFIDGVVGFFTGLYDTLVGHSVVPDMINDIVAWFLGLPAKVLGILSTFVTNTIGAFTDLAVDAIGAVDGMVTDILAALRKSPVFGPLLEAVDSVWTKFKDMKDKVLRTVRDLVSGLVKPIRDAVNTIKELNPFMRHSPSLVDNVLKGTGIIQTAYEGLSGMDVEPAGAGSFRALARSGGLADATSDVAAHGDTYQVTLDVRADEIKDVASLIERLKASRVELRMAGGTA